jgi:hypothetical protein
MTDDDIQLRNQYTTRGLTRQACAKNMTGKHFTTRTMMKGRIRVTEFFSELFDQYCGAINRATGSIPEVL